MLQVKKLTNDAIGDVQNFLAKRPVHSFGLTSFIFQNKLESPNNQGTFYGCTDSYGRLQAVALFGHFSLFEVASTKALKAIVKVAQKRSDLHLMLAEKKIAEKFWEIYTPPKKFLHKDTPYVLLTKEGISSVEVFPSILRLATFSDLENVVNAHAHITREEHRTDPLKSEPEKFRQRCLNRIENKQTWIYVENQEIVFKAELMCQTPELAYLEAIWTSPKLRRRGYGIRCLDELCRKLLQESKSICLLTDANNPEKLAFYQKAGFKFAGDYTASFLKST